jgi:sterol-4alpha-carboxylate 3-dehydrogenase (decarboxylating)
MAAQDAVRTRPSLGTVLVTGGCGFIGSFIVDAFASDPACSRVVAASRTPNKYLVPKVDYRPCDITDRAAVQALLDEVQPRVLVHTVSPGVYAAPADHRRVTYEGTKLVLDLAKYHPSVRAFVWTSSIEAVQLDPSSNHRPLREEDAVANTLKSPYASAYGRFKGATETLVLGSNTDATATVDLRSENADWSGKLLTTSLRITGLYGPRDKYMIPEMLAVMKTPATHIQIGPNELVHSFIYVESAARAHVLAAKALLDGEHLRPDQRVDGEAFFIADRDPMKLWDFSRAIWRAAGHPKDAQRLVVIPFWVMITIAATLDWAYWLLTLGTKRPRMTPDQFVFMSRGCRCSIAKAQQRIGYEPLCDTQEGIVRAVAWFTQNETNAAVKS